mgnify:CR=1 FL=1
MEKEEKELERKYKYDVKNEIEAEKAQKKIKKVLIKTVIGTLLLTGGIVGGTYLTGVSLPIQNIVGVCAIVSGFTGTMYFSRTKDAKEKVAYVKEHNILKEIEYDKVSIENRNFEIDYYKTNLDLLNKEEIEQEGQVNKTNIKENAVILENIEKNTKPMTRVRI